ncbi:WD40/YVTN/BNR-like repeat-containing protein [Paenibacillus sp. SI8]|uniref:WD40/YVTN/BNR-like repeat-containing protein n=1 Tax=unclassified Paenibacillus TaxID=185978 RepID=UPI003465CC2C
MLIRRSMLMLMLSVFILSGCQGSSGSSGATSGAVSPAVSAGVETPAPSSSTPPAVTATPKAETGSGKASEAPSAIDMRTVTAVRLADAKSGWMGGKGWIARTDDGGVKWQVQYEVSGDVQQLYALNGKEAWAAVGKELLGTTDGGQHWVAVGTVPNSAFLHFVTKQEAFSGNAKTMDGGKNWTFLKVPEGITGDAYFHDKDHGWAAKQVKDTISVLRTKDGGKTWSTVMTRKTVAPLTGVMIRSAGANDAWIEMVGDSGMTQTSYALFHTKDGGKNWQTVVANSTAGGGPAPGFPTGDNKGPKNSGTKPGPLYVVSPEVAFMGGQCPSCDKPNTVGWTKDGGKTWVNGKESLTGYGETLLAMADANKGWMVTNDTVQPSVMYTTSNGGANWTKVHAFDAPN